MPTSPSAVGLSNTGATSTANPKATTPAESASAAPSKTFSLKEELERFWGRCEAAWPAPTPAKARSPSEARSSKKDPAPSSPSPAREPSEGSASSPERGSPSPPKRSARSGKATGSHNKRLHRKRVLFATSGTSTRPRGGGRHRAGGRARSPSLAKSDSPSDSPSAKRARSASKESEQPAEPKQPEEGKQPQRQRRKGWDVLPNLAEVITQQRTLPHVFPKKRRECYCGNLLAGQVDGQMLRNMFIRLFKALPVFHECYPDVVDPVRSVAFPQGQGMFAFVEFFDEVIAATAVLMSGFELCGRSVKVGRPQGYVPAPYGELSPLDVEPLRRCGMLPMHPDTVVPFLRNSASSKLRELYFGNLQAGTVTQDIMTEFLMPACMELPEYDPVHGPPITRVAMSNNGQYCFVEFQNADMASRLIAVFDETEFFGRKLRVGRPANYNALQQATPALSAPPSTPVLPAIPPPPLVPAPVESEAFRAGAVAAAAVSSIPTML